MYETESMDELAERANWRITEKCMDGSVVIVAEVGGGGCIQVFRPLPTQDRGVPAISKPDPQAGL